MTAATDRLLAQTLREESGPLVARLSRRFGDFDLAEEAVQSAVVEALTAGAATARRTGRAPGSRSPPSATPSTAYAGARGSARSRRRAEPPADPSAGGTDDRLALLFACCHPALAPEARLALTLRAVVGLTTPQIARAFLVNETHARPAHRAGQAQDRHRRHRAAVPPDGRPAEPARATCWPSST